MPRTLRRCSSRPDQKKLGAYSFAALYQQRPTPREGALFKRDWFGKDKIKDPSEVPANLRWCRGYDLAVSQKTSADYTASFRCAFDKAGNLYIADGMRKRLEFPEQKRYVVQRMVDEKRTAHGIEKALHGEALVQDLRRVPAIRHVPLKAVKVDTDKFTRALAWADLAEEGKVFLVRGPWIDTFLEEIFVFTGKGDKHDDQVDAVSVAVGMLSKLKGKLHAF
jgi:predicted phage terminase large subunit-like protein